MKKRKADFKEHQLILEEEKLQKDTKEKEDILMLMGPSKMDEKAITFWESRWTEILARWMSSDRHILWK